MKKKKLTIKELDKIILIQRKTIQHLCRYIEQEEKSRVAEQNAHRKEIDNLSRLLPYSPSNLGPGSGT